WFWLARCSWAEFLDEDSCEAGHWAALPSASGTKRSMATRILPPTMQFNFSRLRVRRENISIHGIAPVRFLYASDLHLGRPWNESIVPQLLQIVDQSSPAIVLLGGDLIDTRRGADGLVKLVNRLSFQVPVLAIPGNHDLRVGLDLVRSAV